MREKINPEEQRVSEQDIAFIRAKLQEHDKTITLPKSISAKTLMAKIPTEQRKRFREAAAPDFKSWQRIAAIAAALILVVTAYVGSGYLGFTPFQNATGGVQPQAVSDEEAGGLQNSAAAAVQDKRSVPQVSNTLYAESYEDLQTNITAMQDRRASSPYKGTLQNGSDSSFSSIPGAGIRYPGLTSRTIAVLDDQLEAADIVKTDGQFLYYYRPANYKQDQNIIYVVNSIDMQISARIDVGLNTGLEFFVQDNKLTVISMDTQIEANALYDENVSTPSTDNPPQDDTAQEDTPPASYGATTVSVYDLTNKTSPTLERTFRQDGNYIGAKIDGKMIYTITDKNLYSATAIPYSGHMYNLVPVINQSQGMQSQLLQPQDIALLPNSVSTGYTIVSAIDTKSPSATASTKAVLGGGGDVYIAKDGIYVYYNTYVRSQTGSTFGVTKVSTVQGQLDVLEPIELSGNIDNYFALDESAGALRIVTTSNQYNTGLSINHLYVLAQDMSLAGSMEGFAGGSSFASAQFTNNMLYLFAQGQDAPVYVVDITNPANLSIVAQPTDLPAFAPYTRPVANGSSLVGLGRNLRQDSSGAVAAGGLKLSLYLLQNPLQPEEKHSVSLQGNESYSEALDSPKAFLYDGQSGIVGFPLISRTKAQNQNGTGTLLGWGYTAYRIDAKLGLVPLGTVTHVDKLEEAAILSNFQSIKRGLVLGGRLYTFSDSKIVAHTIEGMQQTGLLNLN